MKLKTIAANQTELHLNNGVILLVSYETPVAAFIPGNGWYRTSERYSATTSRHVTQWLTKNGARDVKPMTPSALGKLTGDL